MENIKTPDDHVPAVLERVKKEYLQKTYNVKHSTVLDASAISDTNCSSLFTVLSTKSTIICRVLCESHLFDLLSKRCSISRSVFTNYSYFICAFGLVKSHMSEKRCSYC